MNECTLCALYLELMESHFWVAKWYILSYESPPLTASPLSTKCAGIEWLGQVPINRSCWMGCQARMGSGMMYQWVPAYGFLYDQASLHPTLYPTTHFPESVPIFSAYLSVLPPRVLLNSGSFPTSLQRDLFGNLTRQVRSRNISMKQTPLIWKK